MAEVPQVVEDNSEPLKYKKWVLKVSIHCEGCKRKVKRILHDIDGVYTIDVESKQHKVTVTGDVDSNTLIRKLEKSGKHAELWVDPHSKQDEQVDDQANQNNSTVNAEEAQKTGDPSNGAPENSNSGNNGNENTDTTNGQQQQVRFEGNTPTTGDEKNPPENGGNSGGGKKKKKKKKNNNSGGNNNNNNNEGAGEQQQPNGGQPTTEAPPPQQGSDPGPYPNPSPVNMSPPPHPHYNRMYEYPPAYYAPPPIYAVSYNTSYPSSSYTRSFCSEPPPYSYTYVHHGADVEPHPRSDWNTNSLQPSDTFEIFSDENPNACSVM